MSEVSHRAKQLAIERFVKPEILAQGGKVWPREMKILNALIKTYPDAEFWDSAELNFKLNSLAWFVGEGSVELQKLWRLYKFYKNQSSLDKSPEKNTIVEVAEIPLENKSEKQLDLFQLAVDNKKTKNSK